MNGKAIATTVGLAASVLGLFLYLKRSYNQSQTESVPLAQTRQIIQQIKYQMLIVASNFAEQISLSLMQKIPASQKEAALVKLKANLMQMYQTKEDIVLNKHGMTREEFAGALEAHAEDGFILKAREEIESVMELAVEGKYPDLTIPPEALAANSKERVKEIYQAVCEQVVVAVWKKLKKMSEEDPAFDCKNDQHYKVAVRQVNVYRLRADFLQEVGYKNEWGCPNEVFFKVMETHKREDKQARLKLKSVQKAYNYILQIVSNNPFTFQSKEVIHMMMEDEIVENEKKLAEQDNQLQQLDKSTSDNQLSQANYFFEKGKFLQQSLSQSRAKMDLARGKREAEGAQGDSETNG